MFAEFTFDKSFLTSINSIMSGCDTSIFIISAPRLPRMPIRPVVSANKSINETAPVVVEAALFTLAPLGLKFEILIPQPPPYE